MDLDLGEGDCMFQECASDRATGGANAPGCGAPRIYRDPYVRDVADAGGRSEFVDSGSGGRERREERRQTGAVSLN